MTESTWPKHPDGRNKKMGEMTADERRAQWKGAADRAKAYFEQPVVKAGIAAVVASDTPDWEDLRGVAPGATGDVSSEEFVRNLRAEWPES
jgi:hypothetical protein